MRIAHPEPEESVLSLAICPHCGVPFPLPKGVARHEVPCTRCGKPPLAPRKGSLSPWVLAGLLLIALGLLFVLSLVAFRVLVESGAERLPGLLTGAAGLLR